MQDIQGEMENAKKDFNEFERKDVKFREDLKHFKTKEKKLTEAINKAKEKGQESEHTLKSAKEELERLLKEEKKAQERLAKEEKALEEVLASLKGVTADLHVQLEAKQKEYVIFASSLASLPLHFATIFNCKCYVTY